MIVFERTQDYELIREILTHPRIWPFISDDGSPPADEYQPVQHEAMWYVLVRDVLTGRTDTLGLWVFTPDNAICWEVHTALLPCAWGERGQLAARLLPAWIWANTPCRRIVTNVPDNNRLALHFAFRAGMSVYGVNRDSFLKNGKLCDQVCLGLSAPRETGEEREGVSSLPVQDATPDAPAYAETGVRKVNACGARPHEV